MQAAIEAGITAAEGVHDFMPPHAARLRAVGSGARMVARATFAARTDDGRRVSCPVGLAIPDWPGWDYAWNQKFTIAYDAATFEAIGQQVGVMVLYVTDNEVEAA